MDKLKYLKVENNIDAFDIFTKDYSLYNAIEATYDDWCNLSLKEKMEYQTQAYFLNLGIAIDNNKDKLYSFDLVLHHLKHGGNAKRLNWDVNNYIGIIDNNILDTLNNTWNPLSEDLIADDWELL